MWRVLLIFLGTGSALLSTGFADKWFYIPLPLIPLLVAVACWAFAVRGWKTHLALLTLGAAFVVGGVTLCFVMPQVVNHGSGQDAVGLFATVAGGGTALVGLGLIVAGIVVKQSVTKTKLGT